MEAMQSEIRCMSCSVAVVQWFVTAAAVFCQCLINAKVLFLLFQSSTLISCRAAF